MDFDRFGIDFEKVVAIFKFGPNAVAAFDGPTFKVTNAVDGTGDKP